MYIEILIQPDFMNDIREWHFFHNIDDQNTIYHVVGRSGEDCLNLNFEPISDLEVCKKSANDFNMPFGEVEMVDNYPKGCYAEDNGYVYFNSHHLGKKNMNAIPICKRESKSGKIVMIYFRV